MKAAGVGEVHFLMQFTWEVRYLFPKVPKSTWLHGLHEFSMAFLDDILIHSATWAEHVHHLTQVFDRLSAGLRVKERKCSFAKHKCVHLGYVVGVAQ